MTTLPPIDLSTMTKMEPTHYVSFNLGHSRQILGTSEIRSGVAFGYGYGREDPKLRYKTVPAQMVHYLHAMVTSGDETAASTVSYGYTAMARYRFRTNGKVGAFLDIGWGLQYTDRKSADIESLWNSTPYLGIGTAIRTTDGEFLIGFGWFHISNAGLVPPNHGQNYLHLTFSYRYRT